MSSFSGKILMITGGTGSFGNAVLNRFLKTDIGEIWASDIGVRPCVQLRVYSTVGGIPSNKLLTTAFEVSFESVAVTLRAKRRQQDNRDSYWASKSQSYQRVDIVVWMEDNICIYRYGEILHTSAVLFGTIHVIQGIYINWREPAFSSVVCKQWTTLGVRPHEEEMIFF